LESKVYQAVVKRFLLFGLLFFLLSTAHAQYKEIVLEGKYYGESVFIYNPSIEDSFCVKKIIINLDTITEELNTNAIEVDFSLLEIEESADVILIVVYDSICKPLIVNPHALLPPNPFKFSKPRVRDNTVQWFVYGEVSDYPIEVQHKKFDEWVTVREIDPMDTIRNRYYSANIRLHSGYNSIRLYTINMKGEEVYSKEVQFKPPQVRPVTIENLKVEDELVFSQETEYEIYSLEGKLLLKGVDRYVDVSELEKGTYLLRYDNRTTEFRKKK
jgi:hypothetical protein